MHLVSHSEAERVVGRPRMQSYHQARREAGITTILHSGDCLRIHGRSLDLCQYSAAVDAGQIDVPTDVGLRVRLVGGWIFPDPADVPASRRLPDVETWLDS